MTQSPRVASLGTENKRAVESEYRVRPSRKKMIWIAAGVAVFFVALIFGIRWWMYASRHVETDDAYVQGHVHQISTRIAGTVSKVLVDDNQFVKQGQLLVQLDPRDYMVKAQQAQAAVRLAESQSTAAQVNVPQAAANAQAKAAQAVGNVTGAQAAISSAQAGVATAQAGVAASRAALAQASANLERAQRDYQRYAMLAKEGAVPAQQLDQALASVRVAKADKDAAADNIRAAQSKVSAAVQSVSQARANLVASRGGVAEAQAARVQIEAARRQFGTTQAAIGQAQAAANEAQLALSYTNIYAPTSGIVGRRSVEAGQRLQPGQSLMAIVEPAPWISANFKETQLEQVRPGEPVTIKLDTFPHRTFLGHVTGVSPASGAQFALLPPENATGNFTKIVQRIPVKIEFDPRSIRGYETRILPGMSAVVGVTVK